MVADDSSFSRISQIETQWSLVKQAHGKLEEEHCRARRQLIERYFGAVERYLRKSLGNEDAAAEVGQEFALRFARGDYHRADASRGRFRDYLKTVLFHLIADFRRVAGRKPAPLDGEVEVVDSPADEDADREFVESWRDDLQARAWRRLKEMEENTGRPFYTALRLRADKPAARSSELSQLLSESLAKPVSPESVRQTLHRARAQFADFLIDEISQSLSDPTRENIEQELIDLKLLDYCREALNRNAE